jgi:type IV secretory pathway TrbF-like protein
MNTADAQQLRNGGELDTVYARAAQEWDDRIGSARVQAKNWRIYALVAMGAVLASIAGLIYLGAQPKRVPYFVEIDALGQANYLGERGRTAFSPNDTQIKYHLERFVQDTRSVSSDQTINRTRIVEAFAMLTTRAREQLHTYLKAGGDPVPRAAVETVTTNTIGDVQVAEGVYQIDWREQRWDHEGKLTSTTLWRGMFHVLIHQPENIADVRKNPIGVYIDQLHWDCIGEGCGDGGHHA